MITILVVTTAALTLVTVAAKAVSWFSKPSTVDWVAIECGTEG
jgi:hypothetical protein